MNWNYLTMCGVAAWFAAVQASAGVVESYEAGLGNLSFSDGAAPTVETSTDWATDGVNSAKYTLNADWNWVWNYHNVLTSAADVAANRYLLFDFNVISGQFKLGGLASNSDGGWKQQDTWNDALTPPGTPGQVLELPSFVAGENRGYGVFNAGATGTFAWDYQAAGLSATGAETYLSFQFTLQGPQGSVVHIDNLRVASAVIPEPAALTLAGAAVGLTAVRRRRAQ